jgi:hypothetical protein
VLVERQVELAVQVEPRALASLSEQRADQVGGEAVLGHLADRRVEDHVGGVESRLVFNRVAHQRECLAQSLQFVGRAAAGGVTRDDPLERRTHDTEIVEGPERRIVRDERRQYGRVDHVPRVCVEHLRAASLCDRHESLLLESLDRLADDRAAHPELLAEHGFGGKGTSRREIAAHDGVDETGDDGSLAFMPRWSEPAFCSRTPCGPSTRVMERTPAPSFVDQKPAPVSIAAFAASSASSSTVGVGAVITSSGMSSPAEIAANRARDRRERLPGWEASQ